MVLTEAQQVRLRIQDLPLIADVTRYGDGTAATYQLQHSNLTSASAFIPLGGTAWSATGATFNASGYVDFSGVISANSAFRVRYVHSTFSDTDVDQMLADGGSVLGASREAVQTLMFDGLKRSKWAAPDGTEFSDVDAMKLLKDLWDVLQEELSEEATTAGSIASWSLNQGDF